MFDAEVLCDNIKKYRRKAGMKQGELARRLHVSPQAISRWETRLSLPDVANLCELSQVLGVSVDALLKKEKEETLFIGVDGGGTKTEFVLFNERGHIKKRILSEGTNPNLYGMETVCQTLKNGIDGLLACNTSGATVGGIYCGIAGALSGDNRERIQAFLEYHYSQYSCECNSDIFNVSASATDSENTIVVICGTGLNVSAINGHTIKRVGGWGYLFEGKGSGYDIGRDVLTAVLAMDDGIGQKTMLKEMVEKRIGTTVWDSIHHIYAEKQSYIASFSKEAFEACKKGDGVAYDIVKTNIEAITDKINYLAENFECGNELIMSGGLTNDTYIMEEFVIPSLKDKLEVMIPSMPQIFGACRRCIRKFGVVGENFDDNFIREYKKYQ